MRARTGWLLALGFALAGVGASVPARASTPASGPPATSTAARAPAKGGLYRNLYYSGHAVEAHAVLRSGDERPTRVIVAHPAGNTGVGLWMQSMAPGDALRAEDQLRGVRADGLSGLKLALSGPAKVKIDRFFLDSVRTLRDADRNDEGYRKAAIDDAYHAFEEWGPQADPQSEALRQTLMSRLSTWFAPVRVIDPKRPNAIIFERRAVATGARYRLEIVPREGTTAAADGAQVTLSGPGRTRFDVRTFVERPAYESLASVMAVGHGGDAGKSLAFLASKEKLLAGSWQFLTYFGRDTLISGALLADRGSKPLLRTAVASVLDRIGPRGQVAHEESIGDQATLVHLKHLSNRVRTEGASLKLTPEDVARLEKPVYDYKMIDGEYLLPQLLSKFVGRIDPKVPEDKAVLDDAFKPSRLAALAREIVRVDDQTSNPGREGLIGLKRGKDAGNWRDSGAGLGGGRYPLDVNAYLVPSALRSFATLAKDPRFPKQALLDAAGPRRAQIAKFLAPDALETRAQAWERATDAFRVDVAPVDAKTRLQSFLGSLPAAERGALGAQKLFGSEETLEHALASSSPSVLAKGVSFSAVALDGEHRPVPVLSSDGAFDLFYGTPSRDEVLSHVKTMFQPYPLGLSTPVGIVAANAAFSHRPGDLATFAREKYHGAVVWGWQQEMLREGLEKQLVAFHGDAEVEKTIGQALDVMRATQRNVRGVETGAELWSWRADTGGKIVVVPYGTLAGDATEANDRQLWSIAGRAATQPR